MRFFLDVDIGEAQRYSCNAPSGLEFRSFPPLQFGIRFALSTIARVLENQRSMVTSWERSFNTQPFATQSFRRQTTTMILRDWSLLIQMRNACAISLPHRASSGSDSSRARKRWLTLLSGCGIRELLKQSTAPFLCRTSLNRTVMRQAGVALSRVTETHSTSCSGH
jgi:hypothetical protein